MPNSSIQYQTPGWLVKQIPDEPASIASSAPGAHASEDEARALPARRFRSRDLFAGERAIVIEHAGREYSLLITRQGKLLLNRSV